MPSQQKKILYITWDGPDQNYVESVFAPTFGRIQQASDLQFELWQFGWQTKEQWQHTEAVCHTHAILYRHINVHRMQQAKSLSVAQAIATGAFRIGWRLRQGDIDAIMPRCPIPAAMVLGVQHYYPNIPMVFHSDGLMADERIEFEGWSGSSLSYRILRDIESQAVRRAVTVATLTQDNKNILLERAGPGIDASKIFVIPSARDEQTVKPCSLEERNQMRVRENIPHDALWVIYVGSLGEKYNTSKIFEFFAQLQKQQPNVRLHVLTGQQELAKKACQKVGMNNHHVQITRVSSDDVIRFISAADLGLYFGKTSFSLRGSSPIKVSEYLLCGVPVVATRGTGGLDSTLEGYSDVIHLLPDFQEQNMNNAIDWVLQTSLKNRELIHQRSRELGLKKFSLEAHIPNYLKLFESLFTSDITSTQS